jgi:hypothetical protein
MTTPQDPTKTTKPNAFSIESLLSVAKEPPTTLPPINQLLTPSEDVSLLGLLALSSPEAASTYPSPADEYPEITVPDPITVGSKSLSPVKRHVPLSCGWMYKDIY